MAAGSCVFAYLNWALRRFASARFQIQRVVLLQSLTGAERVRSERREAENEERDKRMDQGTYFRLAEVEEGLIENGKRTRHRTSR
jgi:hypothetical protein